jgi:hypothetical protein
MLKNDYRSDKQIGCDQTGKKGWMEMKLVKQSIPVVFLMENTLIIVHNSMVISINRNGH